MSSSTPNSSKTNAAPKPSPGMRVRVRNAAVYLVYRRLITVTMIAIAAAIVSLVVLSMSMGRQVPPRYIPVTEDGRLIEPVPLDDPAVDRATVGHFAMEAIQALHTFDYLNWRDQLARASDYFSYNGWRMYESELVRTNTMRAVEQRRMISTVGPTSSLRFIREGRSSAAGVYVWQVEIPVEVVYVAHGRGASGGMDAGNRLRGTITLFISRVPMTEDPRGIAIQIYRLDPSGSRPVNLEQSTNDFDENAAETQAQ